MKYIKLKNKYKEGDYILVKNFNYPYNYMKIKNIDHSNMPYFCKWAYKLQGRHDGVWIIESDIRRLLTPEEIEEFNAKKYSKKI